MEHIDFYIYAHCKRIILEQCMTAKPGNVTRKGSVLPDGTCWTEQNSRIWLGTSNGATCRYHHSHFLCPSVLCSMVSWPMKLTRTQQSQLFIASTKGTLAEDCSNGGATSFERFSILDKQLGKCSLWAHKHIHSGLVYATVDQLLNGQF